MRCPSAILRRVLPFGQNRQAALQPVMVWIWTWSGTLSAKDPDEGAGWDLPPATPQGSVACGTFVFIGRSTQAIGDFKNAHFMAKCP
jgi:hypothetical protein